MKSWAEFAEEAPGLAEQAKKLFDDNPHKVMVTLRPDGSPRLSGTEVTWHDGQIWIGMMLDTHRARDLRQNPLIGIHSGPAHPDHWTGDAKLTGRAVEVTASGTVTDFMGNAPPAMDLFRVEVEQVTVVQVGEPADHLVIIWWQEGQGIRKIRRT